MKLSLHCYLPLELRGQHSLIEDGDGALDRKSHIDVGQQHLAVEQTGQWGLNVSSHQEVAGGGMDGWRDEPVLSLFTVLSLYTVCGGQRSFSLLLS